MALTPEQLKAEITRRNKLFRRTSNAKKRVLIAQDVLEQLGKRIRAKSGSFVSVMGDVSEDESVREVVLAKETPSCECCAYGALALSCTLFNNQSTFRDVEIDRYTPSGIRFLKNGFSDIFEFDQLRLIEIAFEGGHGWYNRLSFDFESIDRRAQEYCSLKSRPIDRMRKIMNNIIQNKGTFIP